MSTAPSSSDLKTMAIADIITNHPAAEPVFKEYGLLAYADTETAKYENLQASALVHGVNLDDLLKDLQTALI